MPDSFDGSVVYGQGRIQSSRMRGIYLPTSYFQKLFDAYNFLIISNLFDSDKPYDLRGHNRKCAHKMHHTIFGEALRIRVKKFKQNLREY